MLESRFQGHDATNRVPIETQQSFQSDAHSRPHNEDRHEDSERIVRDLRNRETWQSVTSDKSHGYNRLKRDRRNCYLALRKLR